MIGIDEAGRGAWAGPLVVAGCRFRSIPGFINELRDSKQLSKVKRAVLHERIVDVCETHIVTVPPNLIDSHGLTYCLKQAMEEIARHLPADSILIDGPYNFLKDTDFAAVATTLIKADSLVPEVMAASIVAKVTRDNLMSQYDDEYPGYGFKQHVGYGTKVHLEALNRFGICELHRRSYKPIARLLQP